MTLSTEDSGELIKVSPLYPNDDVLRVFGEIAFLCFHAKIYRDWPIQAIAKVFEPPVYFKQFQVYRARNVPRGLVTWAKLNKAAEAKHIAGEGLDEFDEWRSGDQLWIMDLMAPWGHGRAIIEDVKSGVQENSFKTLRVHNGKRKITEWYRNPGSKKWKIKTVPID